MSSLTSALVGGVSSVGSQIRFIASSFRRYRELRRLGILWLVCRLFGRIVDSIRGDISTYIDEFVGGKRMCMG